MTAHQPELTNSARSDMSATRQYKRHDGLADVVAPGARDHWSIAEILNLLPTLSNWPANKRRSHQARITESAQAILQWLRAHPGDGWQDRWVVSGADLDVGWIDTLIDADDPCTPKTQREAMLAGLASLFLCRIVMPSYQFLASYYASTLYAHARQQFRPDLFEVIESRARERRIGNRQLKLALLTITKLVLHTGRELDELTAEDVLTYRAWCLRRNGRIERGLTLAWSLLREVTDLGEHRTLKDFLRLGQRPTAELVDGYNIQCRPVRDVLVRYLDERRPSMDYGSFTDLVGTLVGTFWRGIERNYPGIDTFNLPEHVAEGWRDRIRTVTGRDGTSRPRREHRSVMMAVRGFYRDLQEWALSDPSWAPWVAPSPIRKGDTAGYVKARRQTTAEMHQRVRDRLPHLQVLIDTAERNKAEQARFLTALRQVSVGETFQHAGRGYRRSMPHAYKTAYYSGEAPPDHVEDLVTGELIDVGFAEHDAFWAWAVISVLSTTGCRIEELLEITHLALVSYKLPDTGEVVPMLQIVPSKSNEERLLLVSPELASVLATVITRLRRENGGTVPLTARYDPHERVTRPPLPHLFQHRLGWTWEVPSPNTVQRWLNQTLTLTGLTDAAGQPMRYTPHDFRRILASDAVSNGLPIHIVARLLGHRNINTTQAYMADEQLVRSYRAFLDNRRALRPEAEYREPTDEEWREFQAHFQARKLELGECGRPYGQPCKHEFACIRCPSLRLDPTARPRLVEIIANLKERIQEARMNGWLGEIEGLTASLKAANRKLVSLDRTRDRQPTGPVNLGMPVITDPR